jgi:ATP-binding cassette subfamily B protein
VRLERDRAVVQLVGRTVSGVGTGLAYGVLALLLYAGGMPLALAGAAALAMRTAGQSVANTIYQINHLYEASFYLDLYRSSLDETRRRSRPPAAGRLPGDPAAITLTGVSFRYPGQEELAVHDVSCTLRRGEVIALVGENGSGKSTLAKLITGLYLAESGTVSWDGVDVATVDQRELHERVAVVFQDPLRWPMHAENNVRIGRLDRPDPGGARLADAAARSGADAVVAELPDGWRTVLSREFQGGRDLSGGQWQRFSVARGLYRDAPVVIADEPTAALDARAEHAVFAALRGLAGTRGDRITVLVTHRLANVKHADQILVLEQGRLIEHGTHEQLMVRGGTYHELFTLQASAYTDGGDARDTVPA